MVVRLTQMEKGLLFVCCMAVYLCLPQPQESVLPFLTAIIVSGLLSLVESQPARTGLTVGYAAACCFWPVLTVFFPLVAFDIPNQKYLPANLVAAVPLGLALSDAFGWSSSTGGVAVMNALPALMVVGLSLMALLMRVRRDAWQQLHRELLAQRDDNREIRERLGRRNRELLERQDADLTTATLEERNRIAREIHDNVGHLLASAMLQTGAMLVTRAEGAEKQSLETLHETLTRAMNRIRQSVHDLRDASVDLHAQLRALADEFRFCTLQLDDQWATDPAPKGKLAVIAICREALANIMKHSDATHAEILLREHPAFHQLVIRDNGSPKSAHPEAGMGLANMAARVQALGGLFRYSAAQGFELFITIPKEDLPKEADAHARTGRG